MEIKHITRIHQEMTSSQMQAIDELREMLSVSDMRIATMKFKMSYEGKDDDNMESLYGVGYVFQTIMDSDIIERDFFLADGKLVVGLMEENEECWLSFGDWYIFADGFNRIEWYASDDDRFIVGAQLAAIDIYEKFFAEQSLAQLRAWVFKYCTGIKVIVACAVKPPALAVGSVNKKQPVSVAF